jgi:hypothetical protein
MGIEKIQCSINKSNIYKLKDLNKIFKRFNLVNIMGV